MLLEFFGVHATLVLEAYFALPPMAMTLGNHQENQFVECEGASGVQGCSWEAYGLRLWLPGLNWTRTAITASFLPPNFNNCRRALCLFQPIVATYYNASRLFDLRCLTFWLGGLFSIYIGICLCSWDTSIAFYSC
jgi:hypothetical protein